MPLKGTAAVEKFARAINQIKSRDTKIIDFSGIQLTQKQLIIIYDALAEIPEDPMPFAVEEYKEAEPLQSRDTTAEYILMNGCGLTAKNLNAIQKILSTIKLYGMALDDNDLDGDTLFYICSRYIHDHTKDSETRTVKIWARGNNAYNEDKDLEQHTDLIKFEIKGESVARRIANMVEKTARSAEFEFEVLSIDNLNKLVEVAQHHTDLKDLSFSGVKFSEEAIRIVAQIITSHPNLTKLTLDECDLNDKDIEILYPALLTCKQLRILFLADNFITSRGASLIARLLSANNLQHLIMTGNYIEDAGALCFSWILATNRSLLDLELNTCMIATVGMTALIGALHSNKSLQSLALNGNPIGDDSLKNLASGNLRLEHLHLNMCGITDLGARYLAATLLAGKAPALHELNVWNNKITADGINGADGLAAGLMSQINLESCDLSGNPLGDASMPAIARLIEAHFKLYTLDLSECSITALGVEILAIALESNSRMTEVYLNKNPIYNAGATALANMLAVNYTLRNLFLQKTGITSVGAVVIFNAVTKKSKNQICSIDLRKNQISEVYIKDLYKPAPYDYESASDNSSDQDIDWHKTSTGEILTQANASFAVRGSSANVYEQQVDTDSDTNSEQSPTQQGRKKQSTNSLVF